MRRLLCLLLRGVQGGVQAYSSEQCQPWSFSGAFQQLLAEFIGGEKSVTCDIVPPQSNCQFKHNPHPLVLLWCSTRQLPCVHLHIPCISGFCITGHPYLMPYFAGLLDIYCWKGQRPADKKKKKKEITITECACHRKLHESRMLHDNEIKNISGK